MGSHHRLSPSRGGRSTRARQALRLTLAVSLSGALLFAGCRARDTNTDAEALGSEGEPRPKTPDRVAPGVLLEGEKVAFGWRAPRDLTLVAHFHDAVHFEGKVKLADLEDYIRPRVVAKHVEVTPERSIFPNAKIRGGDPKRTYRFELTPKPDHIKLVIRDVTPPPRIEGLTEEERWQRAGLTPEGKLLSPHDLE